MIFSFPYETEVKRGDRAKLTGLFSCDFLTMLTNNST